MTLKFLLNAVSNHRKLNLAHDEWASMNDEGTVVQYYSDVILPFSSAHVNHLRTIISSNKQGVSIITYRNKRPTAENEQSRWFLIRRRPTITGIWFCHSSPESISFNHHRWIWSERFVRIDARHATCSDYWSLQLFWQGKHRSCQLEYSKFTQLRTRARCTAPKQLAKI